ncbi:MAG: acyl-ACP thioesterase [Desulfovibrio sp.]|nr:acyl-ACP thioesterase [Desulfovibrio sp.]
MKAHVETFFTRRHEMGQDRLMRIQCICNCLEESAVIHADMLGVGLERMAADNLAWVLAKMRLRLYRRPGPGERITVETCPVGIERLHFRRDFVLYDQAGQILATSVTQWVVMGLSSRRVERLPAHMAALATEHSPLVDEGGDIRIPRAGKGQAELFFPVRLADIDQNQHLNHVHYVDFALEGACLAGKGGLPKRIDLLFRAEALYGDVIGCLTAKEEGEAHTLIHSLFRQADGQELARARTVHA